ncbi:hypothetical protein Pelo_10354 [Pelomyxa schiedti]|nr:hypothetical protein Pelo_10354 [Pelomyxa schiedti]
MMIFGGTDDSGASLDDTHEFNLSTRTWSQVKKRGTKKNKWPRGRQQTCCVTYHGDVYMFGGNCLGSLTNELWCYSDGVWNLLPESPMTPPAAWGYSGTIYNDCIYVFGGNTSSGATSDIYRFSLVTSTWDSVPTSNSPPPRAFHCSVSSDTKWFILFASTNSTTRPTLFCLDFHTLRWHELKPLPALGLMRGIAGFINGNVIIFHGGKSK